MPKKVELPDFQSDKKPAHLLSSARKPGNDVPPPARHKFEHYEGYAEKLQVASAAARKTLESTAPAAKKPAWATSEQRVKAAVEAAAKPVVAAASADRFMDEMRKEMKELRSLLDSRLSASANAPLPMAQPVRTELLRRLIESGFSKALSGKVANRLGNHKHVEVATEKAAEMLSKLVPIADDDLLEHGGIAALVGPTGVGKTTTIAKLAAQFILRHGSRDVALITTDNYRIGAHEQLSIYGRILGVSVKVANDADELREHIASFSDKRLILIDTAGMSQRDMRLAEQIQTLRIDELPIRSYLVMSATSHYKSVVEILDAFQILEPQAVILTKLDEAVSKAMALSALIERRVPLAFITDGQQVPEDIYVPEADRLIAECLAGCDVEDDYNDALAQDGWLAEQYA
jgi:flagellar biosynthesis protein FlhF